MAQPQILVATRNRGKIREYRELLGAASYRLVSLDDVGVPDEVEETGETFWENAALKAALYAAAAGLPALADDSGLEVDALGGEPGVRSARYGEPLSIDEPLSAADSAASQSPAVSMSDQDRVNLLLRNMAGIPWARRTARFRCVICIAGPSAAESLDWSLINPHHSSDVDAHPRTQMGKARTEGGLSDAGQGRGLAFFEGGVAGMIQYEAQGGEGFGYDPVFFLPSYGLTMGQLPLVEKNRISHRADAARKAVAQLANLNISC